MGTTTGVDTFLDDWQVGATFGPAAEKLLQRSPQPDQPAANSFPDRENLNKVSFELPAIDFTPANLITLLFTDQGEFTLLMITRTTVLYVMHFIYICMYVQ